MNRTRLLRLAITAILGFLVITPENLGKAMSVADVNTVVASSLAEQSQAKTILSAVQLMLDPAAIVAEGAATQAEQFKAAGLRPILKDGEITLQGDNVTIVVMGTGPGAGMLKSVRITRSGQGRQERTSFCSIAYGLPATVEYIKDYMSIANQVAESAHVGCKMIG